MKSIFEDNFINYDHHYSYPQFYPELKQIFTSPKLHNNKLNMLSRVISKTDPLKIEKDYFSTNIDKLLHEFKSPTNKIRRQQFRANYNSKQQNTIKHKWIKHLNINKTEIFLLDYIDQYYNKQNSNPNNKSTPIQQLTTNNQQETTTNSTIETQDLLKIIDTIDNLELKETFMKRLDKLSIQNSDHLDIQQNPMPNNLIPQNPESKPNINVLRVTNKQKSLPKFYDTKLENTKKKSNVFSIHQIYLLLQFQYTNGTLELI